MVNAAAPLGLAAGAHPHPHFADVGRALAFLAPNLDFALLAVLEEVVEDFRHSGGRHVAVGNLVDLHYGGQRAATQAGHFFQRKQALGIGVLPISRYPQVILQGILDQFGALHVASRAMADADDMLPDRMMAKLRVEGGDPGDRRGGDLGQLADPLHCRHRQVAIVLLDRLEDRNHRLPAAADLFDALVDETQVQVRAHVVGLHVTPGAETTI